MFTYFINILGTFTADISPSQLMILNTECNDANDWVMLSINNNSKRSLCRHIPLLVSSSSYEVIGMKELKEGTTFEIPCRCDDPICSNVNSCFIEVHAISETIQSKNIRNMLNHSIKRLSLSVISCINTISRHDSPCKDFILIRNWQIVPRNMIYILFKCQVSS